MIRVITIGREFGSGGAEVARLLAEQLGWKLVDRDFIDRIAQLAEVSPLEAERCDERIDSWFHRAVKALWHGGYEGSATSTGGESVVFDSDSMARLARRVIDEAASLGQCVIVGRGAQCILQQRKSAFHVFVYAPCGNASTASAGAWEPAWMPRRSSSTPIARAKPISGATSPKTGPIATSTI